MGPGCLELIDLIGQTMTPARYPLGTAHQRALARVTGEPRASNPPRVSPSPGAPGRALTLGQGQPPFPSRAAVIQASPSPVASPRPGRSSVSWFVYATVVSGWLAAEQDPHFPKPRPMEHPKRC